MAKSPTILFPEYSPDLTELGTGVSANVSGVVPQGDGYGPFHSLVEFTQALPAGCRGYFFARMSDGSVAVFAGTSTRLYKLDNTTFAWADVSKGGTAYSVLVADDNWQFRQFNDLVIAVQINTVPQKYTLSAGGVFADLAGSPPQAAHIAIINRIVMLSGLLSEPRRAQWSDLDAPEVWTAGTGISDFQDMPDGGVVSQVSGGDAYGVVFQDECIRSLIYAPGSAVTFQINRIATQNSLFGQYSVIEAGTRTFFASAQGFQVIESGGLPKPIGKERVDRTFFADVDTANLQLLQGATDPTATRVYWAYRSAQAATTGLFDKVLSYDWSIGQNGRWSILPFSGEFLAALAKPGLTLEQLDAIAPGAIAVTGAANNGSGRIRLTVGALSNANFNIVGQNFIVLQGLVGTGGLTAAANGTWAFTVVDATHIDLTLNQNTGLQSAFVGVYTSGGAIGGSLDALPFSLDSVSRASIAALSAFSPDHKLAFFNGPLIEAIIETSEQDGEGDLLFVTGARVLTDCEDTMVSVGYRMRPVGLPSYTTEAQIDDTNWAPALIETRYARAKVRLPAGSEWTFCRAIQPDGMVAGEE